MPGIVRDLRRKDISRSRAEFYDAAMPEPRGRDELLARLSGPLALAAAGTGTCTLLEGSPGIGKTTVLDALAQRAQRRYGMAVARARADESAAPRPFGLWVDALDADHLLAAEQFGARMQRRDALVDLLDRLAADQPLLVLLDDVQWADDGSLALLGSVIRRHRDLAVALVVALRPSPRPPALASVLARASEFGAAHELLGGLAPEAIDALVTDITGGRPDDAFSESLRLAGGNPFHAREIVGTALRDGALEVVDGVAHLRGSLPASLQHHVLGRVASLSPSAQLICRTIAACGILAASDLATVTALHDQVDAALDELSGAGLITLGPAEGPPPPVGFTHDIIRESIRGTLTDADIAAIARQVAAVLAARGAPAVEVATHIAAGADPGDPAAITWLVTAAAELAPTDPAAGAELYLRAAAIDPDVDQAGEWTASAAHALAWAGRFLDSAAHTRAALATARSATVTRKLEVSLAHTELLAGRVIDALPHLRAAAADATIDDDARANLLAEAATAALWSLQMDECERLANEAIATAERAGSANALARALGVLSRRMNFAGRIDESRRCADRCLEAAGSDPEAQRATPHLYAGMSWWPIDPIRSAATFQEGMLRAERLGIGWAMPVYLQAMVSAAFDSGRWDDAITHYDTARELLVEMDDLDELSMEALVGVARFFRNELPATRASLARMLDTASKPQARVGGEIYLRWLEALVATHDGHRAEGADLLLGISELCDAIGVPHVQLPFLADAVVWGLGTQHHERAVQRSEAAAQLATLAGRPIHRATALRCRAAVRNDHRDAMAAVEELRPTNHRFDLVLACEQAALSAATDGRTALARSTAEEGMGVAEQMGAGLLVRRLHSVLRAAGGGRGVKGPRQRPSHGWESLTEMELQVVALVAEGLTNARVAERLYVSRRTVETHLVHIYSKLALGSRRALIDEATARGLALPR